ncbi:hypothetical protein GOBAR_DD23910 [Gossypium barbadense]|nr:hypothetical protein GOBAR_DD23910 [Gossypium barbadense]
MKRSRAGWMSMSQNWGHNWQSNVVLFGQSCSFRVTGSDRHTSTSWNIVPIPLAVCKTENSNPTQVFIMEHILWVASRLLHPAAKETNEIVIAEDKENRPKIDWTLYSRLSKNVLPSIYDGQVPLERDLQSLISMEKMDHDDPLGHDDLMQ